MKKRKTPARARTKLEPTSIESTPVEPTPIEPTSVEPTPIEATLVEPTLIEPTSIAPTPVEPTPIAPTPIEPTPIVHIGVPPLDTPIMETPYFATPEIKTPDIQTPDVRTPFMKARLGGPSRPASELPRAFVGIALGILIAVVVILGVHWAVTRTSAGGSGGLGGAYSGTQTFCMASALGGSPECGTGTATVNIDSSGDVLGPVLFGKITNGVFTGEADTQSGTSFPMTGTLSGTTFNAHTTISNPTWTWTLHR